MFELVVNPAGAGGRSKKLIHQVEELFSDVEFRTHYSTKEHGIREIVSELTQQEGIINLVILGGDGTMNEAINGIQDFSRVRLGLLPSGSANDLAKDIGISASLKEQIARIKRGEIVRSIDVGELSCRNEQEEPVTARFNVSAGVGWDAEICEEVEASSWKPLLNRIHLGKLIYIAVAIRSVFAMNRFRCLIEEAGNRHHYDQCVFAAAMNHRYEGGGFMFGPNAKDDDGLLDVCVANNLSVKDFFLLFPKAYNGHHIDGVHAFEHRTREVHITSDQPVWVHTDGEVSAKSDSITLTCEKEKLQILL